MVYYKACISGPLQFIQVSSANKVNLQLIRKFVRSLMNTKKELDSELNPEVHHCHLNITIRLARSDEKEAVRHFLRKFFYRDEPCNKYMKLITEETPICEDLEKYTLKNFDSGLNLIAEHKNRIVGVCINSIIERDKPNENIFITDKKFVITASLLGYVEEQAALFQKYPEVSKIFDINILSVDTSYRGKGIGNAFCQKSKDIAKEQGAQLMSITCTSSFSASIAKKNGFEVVYELDYADYKINGEVVLKPEHPHKSIKMLVYSEL